MAPTPEQAAEIKRLIEDEGLSEEDATALATQEILDVPLGADGKPTVPPVSGAPISLPPPLLP
jgi:hypothetical protein